MAFIFNGSTVTFTPAIGEIRLVSFEESGREVEVTNAGDALALYEVGTNDVTATVEINGDSTANIGDSAALTLTLNDGSSESMTLGVCTAKTHGGSTDNPILTTLTFKNTQA